MLKSLHQSSYNLSGLSLEAFIGDITALGQNYAFYQLFSYPHINTISSQVRAVVELLAFLQFQDYCKDREKYGKLSDKQIYSLKRLTLLDILEGKNILSFLLLESKLQLTREELIELLLKLSIDGTIKIKIDESNQIIRIINSEKRIKKMSNIQQSALKAKLHMLKASVEDVKEKVARISEDLQMANKNEKKQQDQD